VTCSAKAKLLARGEGEYGNARLVAWDGPPNSLVTLHFSMLGVCVWHPAHHVTPTEPATAPVCPAGLRPIGHSARRYRAQAAICLWKPRIVTPDDIVCVVTKGHAYLQLMSLYTTRKSRRQCSIETAVGFRWRRAHASRSLPRSRARSLAHSVTARRNPWRAADPAVSAPPGPASPT
jgi:hypothetical protein